jgi:asparagine synthase (glutamine-hydrolysing)
LVWFVVFSEWSTNSLSGIAAVVSLDGSGVPPSDVERMAKTLKPYGPDQEQILARGNAAFVFCLQRFTPEDEFESQPLLLGNRIVMLFDGRIDNRSELSKALDIAVPDLHSIPDGAIALRLFDLWGERAFERILGDFAIIVMDLQEGHLICARDPMGLRPLHYHHSAKCFAVATNAETLFALDWVPRVLNKDMLAATLVNRALEPDITYYQGIFQVPPGCVVRVARNGSLSKNHFWQAENIADVRFKTDHEYVEAFQERLDAAVIARTRSSRPPCSLITGGLDSSSISVIAADALAARGSRLNTYTAVPEAGFIKEGLSRTYVDETPFVRQIAAANPNIVPHFIPPSNGPMVEQISNQVRLGGSPAGSIINGLWMIDIFNEARSAGHNVMLGGEMGNLTISYGGAGLLVELLFSGRWIKLVREIFSSEEKWRSLVRYSVIAPLVPAPVFRKYKQWRRKGEPAWHNSSPINPEFATWSGFDQRGARMHIPFDLRVTRNNKLNRIDDIRSYSETADWLAKLRAGFGIDFRLPAFDRGIVEFCIGVPEEQYLRNGCSRFLIRRAMKGRLPDNVLYSTKSGIQAADWYPRLTREREDFAKEVNRLGANINVSSIIDLQRLAAILNAWPEPQLPDYSAEKRVIRLLPKALAAAYFIEDAIAANIDIDIKARPTDRV